MEMFKDGYSASEIADYLNEKYEVDLYPMQVGRTVKRLQAVQQAKAQDTPGRIIPVTPAEACGIKVEGSNKWITLIQNASQSDPQKSNSKKY